MVKNMKVDFYDIAPVRTEGDFVIRQGKFFEIGDWPDKEFRLTEAEADAALSEFMGGPLNVEHAPSLFDGRLGMIRRLWRQGKDILAEYAIPKWLHEITGGEPLKISSEWDRKTKRPLGAALVLHPRIHDAAMMAAFSALGSGSGQEARFYDEDAKGKQARWNRAGKGRASMSLLESIKALFQRAGVPKEEIEAQFATPELDGAGGERSDFHQAAEFKTMQAALEAQSQTIAAQAATVRALQARCTEAEKQAQFGQDARVIEGLVRSFRMTPAEAEQWRKIAEETPAAFAAARPALQGRTPLPQIAGHAVRVEAPGVSQADADRLDTLTREKMKATQSTDYAACFKAVCKENQDLAAAVQAEVVAMGGH
jgi:hypothetical protein